MWRSVGLEGLYTPDPDSSTELVILNWFVHRLEIFCFPVVTDCSFMSCSGSRSGSSRSWWKSSSTSGFWRADTGRNSTAWSHQREPLWRTPVGLQRTRPQLKSTNSWEADTQRWAGSRLWLVEPALVLGYCSTAVCTKAFTASIIVHFSWLQLLQQYRETAANVSPSMTELNREWTGMS